MGTKHQWAPPAHVKDILESEGVIVIVGTGRSGKTALGHLLAAESTKTVKVLGYPESAIAECPDGWTTVHPDECFTLTDCVLVVDDAALFASSRNFNNEWSKAWIQFQTIISHKNISLIFIIQSTNLLDIGTLRSQRMAVLYKMSDIVNISYERDEFKRVAITARTHIHKIRDAKPNEHPKSFVYDHALAKVWGHPLAEHWSDKLSIPYRDYIVEVGS